ncbi:MAG: helix-turn-helix domain-containing protein [Clostridia bacterium]|nr:helix-turn-helix domain-containing protein [Clostridia bacterium]MBR0408209.1 helix-turn-helix domain-containing protein [Clostridia bacterium]
MRAGITKGEQNLILLEAMIPRNERLYVWCYGADGEKKGNSCPGPLEETLDHAFRHLGGLEKARQYAARPDSKKPLIIGSSIGMQWAVAFEEERAKSLIFVIGPVFYQQPDEKKLRESLFRSYTAKGDTAWIGDLLSAVSQIAVLSYPVFTRYIIMVHNTLTGQQLGLEDLSTSVPEEAKIRENPAGERNRMGVYLAEKALLDMVRQGNINYQSALQYSSGMSPGVPIEGTDPLRQMKTSVIVFATLVSRAAMEGGLSPEVAYSLGDSYIQTAENSRDSGELSALATAMYHDFIYRVHYLHANPNYSHAIQKCCDYIELSLDRKICAADLASLVGYTEYYLTEKFKKETGKSVSSYIRDAKIERAKVLLTSTDLPVSEISNRLAFNTPNYFIQCFRSVVGQTPAQYKKARKPG